MSIPSFQPIHSLLLAAGGLAVAAASHATVVIDQPLETARYAINVFAPLGQSFTAVGTGVESIGVQLTNFNVGSPELLADRFVDLDVYAGSGFGGSLVASTSVEVAAILGDAAGASAFVSFGLGSVAVAPGATYTFKVSDATVRYGISLSVDTNPYAAGRSFYDNQGSPADFGRPARSDLRFNVSAVPEPATAGLLFAGLCVLVHASRRRTAARTRRAVARS